MEFASNYNNRRLHRQRSDLYQQSPLCHPLANGFNCRRKCATPARPRDVEKNNADNVQASVGDTKCRGSTYGIDSIMT